MYSIVSKTVTIRDSHQGSLVIVKAKGSATKTIKLFNALAMGIEENYKIITSMNPEFTIGDIILSSEITY